MKKTLDLLIHLDDHKHDSLGRLFLDRNDDRETRRILREYLGAKVSVKAASLDGTRLRVRVEVPAEFARYIASKGSVALDGISLTVNAVQDTVFEVNLIPHTREVTNLSDLAAGRRLNLEVDSLARYAERVLVHLRP